MSEVIENKIYTNHIGKLVIKAPAIATRVQAGQFVHIRLPDQREHILRRPFGIYRCNVEHSTIEIVYQVVGAGTQHMMELKTGFKLDLMGPLGHGWTCNTDIDYGKKNLLLVAGGIGAAPIYMLAEKTLPYANVTVLMGAQDEESLVMSEDFENLLGGNRVHLYTDNGSKGCKGLCTEPLRDLISSEKIDYIAACGPYPMLRVVAQHAHEAGIICEVSLEERMACGIGSCLSCVVDTHEGKKRVCTDGPVFRADEVIWHD